MDPNILSKYEIIYETLSTSESDSETYTPADRSNYCDGIQSTSEKKRVIKNFIICQPTSQKKDARSNISDIESSCSDISGQQTVPFLQTSSQVSSLCVEENETDVNNDGILRDPSQKSFNKKKYFINDAINETADFGKGLLEEGSEKEGTKAQINKKRDWTSVVNFIERGGPSLDAIQEVIEQTICRVLHEELPPQTNNGMAALIDTSKKTCPHCKFSTLSKFSLKKHIALHENKPHLVFSQGITEKSSDELLSGLLTGQYQCPKCCDLFRTETGLKYHNCLSGICEGEKEENGKEYVPQENVIPDAVPLERNESVLLTAVKFLNQKPIDLENMKEEVNFVDNERKPVIINKEDFQKTLLLNNVAKTERSDVLTASLPESVDIKEEFTPSPSIQHEFNMDEEIKLEPYEIVLENLKTEDGCDAIGNIKREIIETGVSEENRYDDLERRIAILTGEGNNDFCSANPETVMEYSVTDNSCNEPNNVTVEELPIEIKYNALEDNNNVMLERKHIATSVTVADWAKNSSAKDRLSNDKQSGLSVHDTNANGDNDFDRRLTDLQASWRANTDVVYQLQPRKEFSDERLQFNNLLDTWMKAYQEIYPFLSARKHVPGGIPCPYCQAYYKSFHLLRRHWGRIHNPEAPLLTCASCEYRTNQKELLDSHVKNVHNKFMRREHPCDKCSKIYCSSTALMRHKLLNHTDKSNLALFKCNMCKFSSFDSSNLKRHIERKHLNIGRSYLCMYCGHLTKSKCSLQKHEMNHLGKTFNFTCKLCLNSFDHKLDLLSHQQVVHSPEPLYFNCHFCEFRTVNKELLVVHDNVSHRNVKHFKCPDCSSTLKDMDSLAQHISRKHNPYLIWKYCAHCSYKSISKGALSSHVLIHLPRKSAPIKCKLCKYRTYKREHYKRHFNTRHNPNAIYYQCYHCNYANKVKAKLHQHMQEKRHLLT